MKALKSKKVEGCLEGSNIYDILLSKKIDMDFIEYMGRQGKLIINHSFDKPFFQVIVRGKYTYKGAISNKSIRILFPEGDANNELEELKSYINNFESEEHIAGKNTDYQ